MLYKYKKFYGSFVIEKYRQIGKWICIERDKEIKFFLNLTSLISIVIITKQTNLSLSPNKTIINGLSFVFKNKLFINCIWYNFK